MSGPASAASRAGPGFAGALRAPVATALNHLLGSAAWACERLQPHAGKTARFSSAPFRIALTILSTGKVADAASDTAADVSFAITPGQAMRVLAADAAAWREVTVEGDTVLARDILYVAENLRWDVEEDLSRVVGDIASHRMTQAARGFWRWQRDAAEGFTRSAAIYWTEERPLLAAKAHVETFAHGVDALRDDAARLEKRIEELERRLAQ